MIFETLAPFSNSRSMSMVPGGWLSQRPRGRRGPSWAISDSAGSDRICSISRTAFIDSGRSGRLRPRRQ